MIQLQHIYKTYQGATHALKNIDLEIEKGEFVFLTGPSGAGKSTLFRLISAFDKPTSGQILVNGMDLSMIKQNEIPYYRRRIGVIFQDFKLLKNKSVFENIALPLKIRNESESQIYRKVYEILDKLNLSHRKDFFPEHLSGGEQQRTAIARAIVHQPSLLIADEPTGNLDPKLSLETMDLLSKICSQGTTVFVASHDLNLIQKYNKRRIHIENGEISCP